MPELPVLKIFLSSPGDVAEERALAEIVFRRLAEEFSESVQLRLVIWEHEPVFGHTGYQQQIERPSQCDLVVSILWSRLGTRLPSDFAPAAGGRAPTGTEFELEDALASHAAIGKPNLLIYRKIPGPQVGLGSTDFDERSEQYRRLDEFCRHAFYDAEGAVIVAHVSFSTSHEFERRLAEHVRRWLHREIHSAHAEQSQPLWRGQSPFRGLQTFEAEHRAIFFGRSEAVGELIRRLRETEMAARSDAVSRLLLVQGMSGTGKTSLFKAGLLPLLELRPVEGIATWTTLVLRPSESEPTLRNLSALGVLASRLSERVPAIQRLGMTVQTLAEMLCERPEEAAAKIDLCVAADAERAGIEPQRVRLLLYVDQLEEVFVVPDSSAAAGPLLAAMVALARSTCIWVGTTLRSDFAHRLEAYPELTRCLARNPPYTLLPPRPDELAEMIREPAIAAGLLWEQRDGVSLDQELLRDATGNPEALPLLEYTLAELYERREGRLLRWSEYGGGLQGALIAAADEVLDGTGGDAAAFRVVMRELVGVGEDGAATRRYASLARFPEGSAARSLLDRLVARRLCVTTDAGRGDGPVAYLAHEALIRSWPRAQEWLQRETALLRVRDEFARDAAIWDFHARADDWLGVAPEKLSAMRRIEDAGLMPAGAAAQYAARSRRRAARDRSIKRGAVAGLCLLAVVASVASVIALDQRKAALTERNTARAAAKTAERTTEFMVNLFEKADPEKNLDSITVREVLDQGARTIRSAPDLEAEPRVRATLLTAMGQAYAGLGIYGPAAEQLAQARAAEGVASVPDDLRVRTLNALGTTMFLTDQNAQATALFRQSVELARKTLPPSNALRSAALTGLADVLSAQGKYAEAEQLCQEALVADRQRGSSPADITVLANTLDSLGSVYFQSGNLAQAEVTMRQASSLYGRVHDVHSAQAMSDLGAVLYQSGHYEDALNQYQQALPVFKDVYGSEHPQLATLLNNLGRIALITGRVDEAEPLLRDSLAMTVKFDGENHQELVATLNSLGMIDAYRGRVEEARGEFQRAGSIGRLGHGELLDQVLLNEADVEIMRGDLTRAAELLKESRKLLEKNYANDNANAWRYAIWDTVNAELLAKSGDAATAAHVLADAQKIITQRFGQSGFYNLLAQRRALAISSPSRS